MNSTPHSKSSAFLHGKTVPLPDPLTMNNGAGVGTPQDWSRRRGEILELFRANVYGRAPMAQPNDLCFETVIALGLDGAFMRKQVAISCGGKGVIRLALLVPAQAKEPAPCFVLIGAGTSKHIDATGENESEFWPVRRIVARGYAAAMFYADDVAPDRSDTFFQGVPGLFEPTGVRAADDWGAIGTWAWGASRVMDYLQTDAAVDAARVALVGHSRGGKAALWAGAQDERFALTVSNNSGSTGAALARGKKGESIREINTGFPYWFCDNYKSFNDRESDLPVDQHMLLSLIAPRLLYIASASTDDWADPAAEFAAGVAASPVYGLLGAQGLETTRQPEPQAALHAGRIGCHLREGAHDLLAYDWNQFMDFADKHLPVTLT